MRDAAHLPGRLLGTANRAVAALAGHSAHTMNSGITREYIGDAQELIWNKRAASSFVDEQAPKFAATPFQPVRNSTRDINAYMESHDMDKSDTAARQRASIALHKQAVTSWRNKNIQNSNQAHNAIYQSSTSSSPGKPDG
ncbi:hypothetical protein F4778DRAFT_645010 [Xylariomycetidae sp. FL2044]|nr:hypothetical protein F4778DRAFT_645010 [Xylariomycetidae sp. FL2044]